MKRSALILGLITEAFVPSAAVQAVVLIPWTLVADAGNSGDVHGAGFGSVAYSYRIAEHSVTNAEYTEFLNAVATTDTYGLYNTNMASGFDSTGGIMRSGVAGSYVYSVKLGRDNNPVNYVTFYDTLRFANWMHNGQATGAQDATTTEDGAYDMSLGSAVVRKAGAHVCLPNEDEWYKAAFYKGGGANAGYWDFATGSDTTPTREPPPGGANSANYDWISDPSHPPHHITDVGAYSSSVSPYGTFDQNGNVWEWNETLMPFGRRGYRGSSWAFLAYALPASFRSDGYFPTFEFSDVGFRLASPDLGCIVNADCNDNNPCTVDTCMYLVGCSRVGTGITIGCDDGNACTTGDVCQGDAAGTCQGTDTSTVDCDDGIACTTDTCDPAAGCANTPVDAACDDGLFCDGAETCDGVLGCQAGAAVCSATCEHCDEGAGTCELCVLDLDGNQVMGTGDFALFTACFGACYPLGDPCRASNFDGDPNGCAGTGDYAGFVGCFGLTCGECANCSGPGSSGSGGRGAVAPAPTLEQRSASVQLVAVRIPTPDGQRDRLPRTIRSFAINEELFVEVWASRGSATVAPNGLAAVYMDLFFDPMGLTVEEILPSELFQTLARGVIDRVGGVISAVGGCAPLGDGGVGMTSKWVRVATLHVRAEAVGDTGIALAAASRPFGVSIFGQFGNVDPSRIEVGDLALNILKRTKPRRTSREDRE